MSEPASRQALPPVRHEKTDVRFRGMLALFTLILSLLLLTLLTAYLLFPRQIEDHRFARPFPNYPAPRLQPNPPVDMSVFHAQEMRQLNGTGWQDKAAGIVHIPISQAMDLIAREGIPGWPASTPGNAPLNPAEDEEARR